MLLVQLYLHECEPKGWSDTSRFKQGLKKKLCNLWSKRWYSRSRQWERVGSQRCSPQELSLPVTFHQSVKIHVGHNWSTSVDFVPCMSCWRGCWQIICASSMEGYLEWFLDAQKYCHSLCAGERSDCDAAKIFSAFRGRKLEVLHHFRRSGDMLKESAFRDLVCPDFSGQGCPWMGCGQVACGHPSHGSNVRWCKCGFSCGKRKLCLIVNWKNIPSPGSLWKMWV